MRLLDHQMFAGADRGQRRFQVQRRGRGDAHRIQPRLPQQFIEIIAGETDAVFPREALGGAAAATDDADQFAAVGPGHGARMEIGDGARADEAETQLPVVHG